MARLRAEFLGRVEAFAHRAVDVAEALAERGTSPRVVNQLIAAGTSVGANVYEADEAMTRKDFVKCLCIATKELNEVRFWLRFTAKRDWLPTARLSPLETESVELKTIMGTMISRTRRPASGGL